MKNIPSETEIHAHFEKEFAPFSLSKAEILEVREAVSRITDQILDHYFDQLRDE